MSDQPSPATSSPGEPHCPWCSAALPSETAARCPSCGATVHEETVDEIPGVTRIDPEAILRARSPAPKSRGLIGWLAGDYVDEGPPVAPGTFAPPPDDVKREMLRLELAALEAEVRSRRGEVGTAASAAGSTETGPAPPDAHGQLDAPADHAVDPDADAGQAEPTAPST